MENFSLDHFVSYLISAVVGALVIAISSRISRKSAVFIYHSLNTRIGVSADDPDFGEVRATWEGKQLRNLHLCAFEIENASYKDYENFEFRIHADQHTVILNDKAEIADSPYKVPLSSAFETRCGISSGVERSPAQFEELKHNREYSLPVFNRRCKLKLIFLCSRPEDDLNPELSLATMSKGVRLKKTESPNFIVGPMFGVSLGRAIFYGTIFWALVVFISVFFIKNIAIASIICGLAGAASGFVGAIVGWTISSVMKMVSA